MLVHRIVVSGTVLVSAGVRSSTRVLASARRARGFSLIELMVVIIIIGIVSALAVPTMLASRLDRNAYDDAGAVMTTKAIPIVKDKGDAPDKPVPLDPKKAQKAPAPFDD